MFISKRIADSKLGCHWIALGRASKSPEIGMDLEKYGMIGAGIAALVAALLFFWPQDLMGIVPRWLPGPLF
jgi:hypothetical protein